MTTLADAPLPTDRRVCVWFGEDLIADAAAQFEAGMRRRFVSLRVTNQPAAPVGNPDADH